MAKGTSRRVFNNVFYQLRGVPGDVLPAAEIDLRERAGHAILDAGPALRAFLQRNAARV